MCKVYGSITRLYAKRPDIGRFTMALMFSPVLWQVPENKDATHFFRIVELRSQAIVITFYLTTLSSGRYLELRKES